MRIYYTIPYDTNKNLGKYYNDFMKLLPNDDDFACFVDGDTIFTTYNYGLILEKTIERYPQIGCFTAMTNRVNCKWQIAPGINQDSNDIEYHRKYGNDILNIYDTFCEDVTNKQLFSGFLILLNKKTWEKVGGFLENGMLGVDNDLHKKLIRHDEKMYLMKGVYLYHWYRNNKNKEIKHLL